MNYAGNICLIEKFLTSAYPALGVLIPPLINNVLLIANHFLDTSGTGRVMINYRLFKPIKKITALRD